MIQFDCVNFETFFIFCAFIFIYKSVALGRWQVHMQRKQILGNKVLIRICSRVIACCNLLFGDVFEVEWIEFSQSAVSEMMRGREQ